MIAAIDVGKLFELVWAAALAGIGVAVCFAVFAPETRRAPADSRPSTVDDAERAGPDPPG